MLCFLRLRGGEQWANLHLFSCEPGVELKLVLLDTTTQFQPQKKKKHHHTHSVTIAKKIHKQAMACCISLLISCVVLLCECIAVVIFFSKTFLFFLRIDFVPWRSVHNSTGFFFFHYYFVVIVFFFHLFFAFGSLSLSLCVFNLYTK